MKNQISNAKWKVIGVGVSAMGMLAPILAHAQMSTTTANDAFDTVVSDVSGSIESNVVKILSVVAGLIALGWAYRKFTQKASGKKF